MRHTIRMQTLLFASVLVSLCGTLSVGQSDDDAFKLDDPRLKWLWDSRIVWGSHSGAARAAKEHWGPLGKDDPRVEQQLRRILTSPPQKSEARQPLEFAVGRACSAVKRMRLRSFIELFTEIAADDGRDPYVRICAADGLAKFDPGGGAYSAAIETLIRDGVEEWGGPLYEIVKRQLPLLPVGDCVRRAEEILEVVRRRNQSGAPGISGIGVEAKRVIFEANRDREMETMDGVALIDRVVGDFRKGDMDLVDRGRGLQTVLRRGLAGQAIAAARNHLADAANETERGRLLRLMDELGADLTDEETILLDKVFPPFVGE